MTPSLALVAMVGVALGTHHQDPPVQSVAAQGPAPVPTTAAPTTSTTFPPIVVTAPPTTVAKTPSPTTPRPAAPSPPTTALPLSPLVRQSTSKVESCGWGWDAQRIDDGSYDGVVISLDAPRRPNSLVTITAQPHGPTTLPTVRAVLTDGNGQASMEVRLSEDKRDWTLTIGASFGSSACTAQSFTIAY